MDRRNFLGTIFSIPLALKIDLSKLEAKKKELGIPEITLAKEDTLKAKLLDPGWYQAKIIDVQEIQSRTGPDSYFGVKYQVEGIPVSSYYTHKAPMAIVPLLNKTGLMKGHIPPSIDLSDLVGRELRVWVKQEQFANRKVNIVEVK